MRQATIKDKHTAVDILVQSFDDNKSVNYIVRQDKFRLRRLRRLMEYSFDYCILFGEVAISDDGKACALLMFPERKRTTLRSILLDVKLALGCIGISNLKRALKREADIKRLHPNSKMYYLWFIGVLPENQNMGIGSSLLQEIVNKSEIYGRPLFLETSTEKNVPFYKKFGFAIYNELDFGYRLYCMKLVH